MPHSGQSSFSGLVMMISSPSMVIVPLIAAGIGETPFCDRNEGIMCQSAPFHEKNIPKVSLLDDHKTYKDIR